MSELFNRDIAVTVGTRRIASRPLGAEDIAKPILRMAFNVEKTLSADPNKADLQIWNLSKDSRSAIQTKNAPVIIEAGYVDTLEQIFSGDMSFASHVREGIDWITRMQAGDGEKQYRSARINESFKAGVSLGSMINKAASSMGLGLGNIAEKIRAGDFRGSITEFAKGIVLSGKSSDVLEDLLKTAGYDWQIHDGQIEIFKAKDTTEDTAVVLNLESGLVGTPELGEDGAVKARSLLNGNLFPGRKVQIIARLVGDTFEINGFFRIQRVVHSGDTWGGDWYSDIEAKQL